MKKLILLIICLMASVMANAQYKVSSVDKQDSPNITLHQVLETENSVLVYCTLTSVEDKFHSLSINRTTKAEKNNAGYKLLNSINLPIKDEAEPRYLLTRKLGEKVNFVLEFAKFDLNGTFDIVEDDTKHESGMLNFYGIHLEPIDIKDAIDTERFLDCSHVIYGYYKVNGHTHAYYIKDNLMFMFRNSWYGKDFLIHLEITNNSDHGVMLDLSKIRTEGTDANGKPVEVLRYTPDTYDARIESDRYATARANTTDDVSRATESLIFHERITTKNEWGKLGFLALEQAYKQSQENRIQEYLKEHPNTEPKAIRSNGIKAGESIIGFIPFKVKNKCKNVKIYIPMDDYEFLINYNI